MVNVMLPTVIDVLSLVPFDPTPPPDPDVPGLTEFLANPLLAMFKFITGIIPSLVTMIIKFIAKAILMGMTSMFIKVMAGLTVTTSADLTNTGILEWFSRMFGLGVLLCIAFLALQLVSTSIRMQQLTGVVEAVKAFVTAIVGTVLLVPFANTASIAVDLLSVKTLGIALKDNSKAVSNLLEVFDTNGPASWFIKFTGSAGSSLIVITGLIMTILLGLFMLFAMTVLIAVMVLRDMLLILVLITGPVAIAGMVWAPTSSWPRRWGTAFVALLFTKFGIALVFAVGLSMMANAHWVGDIRGVFIFMMAIVMIVVALAVPFMAFRFFDFLGEAAIGGMDQQLMNSGRSSVGRAVGHTRSALHTIAGAPRTLNTITGSGRQTTPSSAAVNQTASSSGVASTSVTGGGSSGPTGSSSAGSGSGGSSSSGGTPLAPGGTYVGGGVRTTNAPVYTASSSSSGGGSSSVVAPPPPPRLASAPQSLLAGSTAPSLSPPASSGGSTLPPPPSPVSTPLPLPPAGPSPVAGSTAPSLSPPASSGGSTPPPLPSAREMPSPPAPSRFAPLPSAAPSNSVGKGGR
ncbi:hypothetical protein HHJ73_10960 [Mobiluncus mulieris]|uniref:hypothetical protein n=1 Tax=Mobiluncus mulieris TaxID=2052 RepID=UPI00146FE1F4|nr:hypothetical protein [Mobiluncus mulieris]NMW82257.1 hypothetical protein [Mobiluncus mulieris]